MTERSSEQRIAALRSLFSGGSDVELLPALEKGLRDRSNLVVAEAARLVALGRHGAMIPDLLDAFDRLFENCVRRDPKCWGKSAIVRALATLEFDESAPYLRAASHVQLEPVWGGREDAATGLRACGVAGLVQVTDLSRPGILALLVDAMADPSDEVRLAAVRAVGQMGGDDAALLLRLKARLGDRHPRVSGQVFDGLIALDPESGPAFVGQSLGSENLDERTEAALSLGTSRLPAAAKLLMAASRETRETEFRETLFRALSASGRSEAIDFLIDMVRAGTPGDARMAAGALEIHGSPQIAERLNRARLERDEALDG